MHCPLSSRFSLLWSVGVEGAVLDGFSALALGARRIDDGLFFLLRERRFKVIHKGLSFRPFIISRVFPTLLFDPVADKIKVGLNAPDVAHSAVRKLCDLARRRFAFRFRAAEEGFTSLLNRPPGEVRQGTDPVVRDCPLQAFVTVRREVVGKQSANAAAQPTRICRPLEIVDQRNQFALTFRPDQTAPRQLRRMLPSADLVQSLRARQGTICLLCEVLGHSCLPSGG